MTVEKMNRGQIIIYEGKTSQLQGLYAIIQKPFTDHFRSIQ